MTLLNLLQIVLYTKEARTSLGESALDLCDYCCRRLCEVNVTPVEENDKEDGNRLRRKEMAFSLGIISLSLLRYLSEDGSGLPLAVQNRMMLEKDLPMQCVDLIHAAPWLRKTKEGGLQVFEGGAWRPQFDGREVSTVEIQVWLLLANLLCDRGLAERYPWSEKKQKKMLALEPLLTESFVKQCPPLGDLQRYLFNVKVAEVPEIEHEKPKISPVAELLPKILHNLDVQKVLAENLEVLCEGDRLQTAKRSILFLSH